MVLQIATAASAAAAVVAPSSPPLNAASEQEREGQEQSGTAIVEVEITDDRGKPGKHDRLHCPAA